MGLKLSGEKSRFFPRATFIYTKLFILSISIHFIQCLIQLLILCNQLFILLLLLGISHYTVMKYLKTTKNVFCGAIYYISNEDSSKIKCTKIIKSQDTYSVRTSVLHK